MQKENKDPVGERLYQQLFLSYLCRTFALFFFSTWKQFSQPLSLGVQFTFLCRENAVTVSRTLKFSAPLIAKVFAVWLEMNYQLT